MTCDPTQPIYRSKSKRKKGNGAKHKDVIEPQRGHETRSQDAASLKTIWDDRGPPIIRERGYKQQPRRTPRAQLLLSVLCLSHFVADHSS